MANDRAAIICLDRKLPTNVLIKYELTEYFEKLLFSTRFQVFQISKYLGKYRYHKLNLSLDLSLRMSF